MSLRQAADMAWHAGLLILVNFIHSVSAEENTMSSVAKLELVWTFQYMARDSSYIFSFDPVFGLKDIDGHQIGVDGWKYLSAPDSVTPAVLVVDYGITLEQLNRAIERLKVEGGFHSVVISVDLPVKGGSPR
ncbi:MAG: hypothetical protein DM484_12810 [Candidatus Methylumidiphilus alinenensis]|uniref:Uncharacterized protein n=1 Tax=Candidatus Methylumidiphilus alinenensis TaxID=2202197 RepID=A0A2W4R2S6_9GAMM|nr:MAG: hypothetical protein DM484_12810 [Candidatus Methylumidiphilus alinenensis]